MKTIKIKYYFFSAMLLLGIAGCDQVADPVIYRACDDSNLDESMNVTHTSNNPNNLRKILLEDYTGHTCGNCPEAGIKMKEMVAKYGDQIVPMAVHAGYFAKTSDDYPTDFSTPAGEDYFTTFNVITNPNGMVNRSSYNGKVVLGIDQWDQAIQAIKDSASEVALSVESIYNTDRKILYINTSVKFLKASTKRLKVVAHLIEDGIIADQKDYSQANEHVKDYEHGHVLRTTAEDKTWGAQVNVADAAANEVFDISFDKLCVEGTWNESNCIVVVYVFDDATKEVVQVDEVHIL